MKERNPSVLDCSLWEWILTFDRNPLYYWELLDSSLPTGNVKKIQETWIPPFHFFFSLGKKQRQRFKTNGLQEEKIHSLWRNGKEEDSIKALDGGLPSLYSFFLTWIFKKKREPTILINLFFEMKKPSKNRVVLIPEELVSQDLTSALSETAFHGFHGDSSTHAEHWASIVVMIEVIKNIHGERIIDIPWGEWQVLSATCHDPRIRVFTRFYNLVKTFAW